MMNSTYVVSGSYECIAHRVFSGLDCDLFYLEYDTERAGDFQPLRHIPLGKNVVLGVVSTKDPMLEALEWLVGRVEQGQMLLPKGGGEVQKGD